MKAWTIQVNGYFNDTSDCNATRTLGTDGKWSTSGSGSESNSNGSSYTYDGVASSYSVQYYYFHPMYPPADPYLVIDHEYDAKTTLNQVGNSMSEYVEYWSPVGAGWEKTGSANSTSSSDYENCDRVYSDTQWTGSYYDDLCYIGSDRHAHDDSTSTSIMHTNNGNGSQSQVETSHGSMTRDYYRDNSFLGDLYENTFDGFNSQATTTTTYSDGTPSSTPPSCTNVVSGQKDETYYGPASYGPLTVSDPGYYSGNYYTPADFWWLNLTGYYGGPSQAAAAASSAALMTSMSAEPTTTESVVLTTSTDSGSLTLQSPETSSSPDLPSLPKLSTSISLNSQGSLFSSTRTGGPSSGSFATPSNRTFDAMGRLTSLTDANFAVTNFGYDASGNLSSLTDPVQNSTQWSYDDQNRLTQETNVLGDSRNYVYDAAGDLIRYIDRNDAVRQYSYDAQHRVVAETWYASVADADAGQNALNEIEYAYDTSGRIVFETDNYSSVAYAYNDTGQITSTTTASASTPTVTLDYQYDAAGQRSQMAAAIDGVCDFIEDYTHDDFGRVITVSQHGVEGGNAVAEKEIVLSYNDAGQLQTIQRLLNGQLAFQADYAYNDSGQLTSLIYHQGDTTLASYAWTYSQSGSPLLSDNYTNADWLPNGGLPAEFVEQGMLPVHDTTGVVAAIDAGGYAELSRLVSCTSTDGTATYSYDPAGQLMGADYDYQTDESYSYDANGNRIGNGYVIGPDNRLLYDGVYRFEYDSEGNRTARFIDADANDILSTEDTDITEYTWDARNRLTKITDYETYGGDPTQVVDYLYDLENRWIGKRVDLDGDGVFDSQEGYVYDGNQMVLQFEGDDLRNRYLWQPDAVDQLMADEQISDEVVLTLTDHLGTVRDLAVMDSQSGETSVVNHITYDAYGQKLSETAAVDCLFGFTGRAFDDETGLQNNLNRWYDSKVGRWISKDPIGFEGRDANAYRYVGNGPTNFTDPTGNILWIPAAVAGAVYWFWTDTANAPAPGDTTVPSAKHAGIPWAAGAGITAGLGSQLIRAGAARALSAGGTYLGIGSQAVNPMGLGAGTWPAILVNGQVYIARMHEVAWQAAGRQAVQKYGYVVTDAAGKVLKWAYE